MLLGELCIHFQIMCIVPVVDYHINRSYFETLVSYILHLCSIAGQNHVGCI